VWLGDRDGRRVSTHDLAGQGRFCLLTGIAGQPWADAAAKVADELGVPLVAHVIRACTTVRSARKSFPERTAVLRLLPTGHAPPAAASLWHDSALAGGRS
jgi:hypothetical protein